MIYSTDSLLFMSFVLISLAILSISHSISLSLLLSSKPLNQIPTLDHFNLPCLKTIHYHSLSYQEDPA